MDEPYTPSLRADTRQLCDAYVAYGIELAQQVIRRHIVDKKMRIALYPPKDFRENIADESVLFELQQADKLLGDLQHEYRRDQ